MALTKINSAGLPAGTVLQAVSATKTNTQQVTGAHQDVLSATITPSNTSSKILIQVLFNGACDERYASVKLYRATTQIGLGDADGTSPRVFMSIDSNNDEPNNQYVMRTLSGNFLDSPSSTSAITYKITAGNDHSTSSSDVYVNMTAVSGAGTHLMRGITTITLSEVTG
tara:strand:- start:37 stop:543 length:507 start_codon:yes stop_codon:yes gene_type:complete